MSRRVRADAKRSQHARTTHAAKWVADAKLLARWPLCHWYRSHRAIWIGGMAINAFPALFERSGADHTALNIVRFTRELATEFGYSTATPPYF